MKLTTHLHLVPRSRMHGAILLLPNIPKLKKTSPYQTFIIVHQLPIKYFAFIRYKEKNWEYKKTVHQLSADFKKA
jgi:hypothetical protein